MRDREIYPDAGSANAGRREPAASDRLPSYRSESPTGYSSTGGSPAEPASASPVTTDRGPSGWSIKCAAQPHRKDHVFSPWSSWPLPGVSSLFCAPGDISILRRQMPVGFFEPCGSRAIGRMTGIGATSPFARAPPKTGVRPTRPFAGVAPSSKSADEDSDDPPRRDAQIRPFQWVRASVRYVRNSSGKIAALAMPPSTPTGRHSTPSLISYAAQAVPRFIARR